MLPSEQFDKALPTDDRANLTDELVVTGFDLG
jgi:hypothetical protein